MLDGNITQALNIDKYGFLALTILVRVALSGVTKMSQNSRIICILPVISFPPSPSPDV